MLSVEGDDVDRVVGRPSLKDVAKASGVSYQSVSRILNDQGRYAAETRERVRAAAAELGYHRSIAARALVTKRSQVIGVIADGSPRYGPVSTLAAVERAARDARYNTLVVTVRYPTPDELRKAMDDFIEHAVEGVVVIAPRIPMTHASRLKTYPVPTVMLAPGEVSREGLTVFSEDQEMGARLATEYLIGLGHRSIAHLAGSQDWLDGQVRLRGWRSALEAAGLPAPAVMYGDWTGESAYEIGRELVQRGDLPDAVFAASDLMALAFMRALNEAGLKVPDDISIVGFDDNEFAPQMSPPLTTVRQAFDQVGRRCMEILLGLIDRQPVDALPVTPELVIRQSAAPAKR